MSPSTVGISLRIGCADEGGVAVAIIDALRGSAHPMRAGASVEVPVIVMLETKLDSGSEDVLGGIAGVLGVGLNDLK